MFKALDFTWNHKRLWFLGVFAGLVNSGGVIEVLVRGMKDVMSTDFNWGTVADAVAPGASLLLLIPDMIAGNNLSTLGAATLWLVLGGLVVLGFWFFSLAQGTLLAAVEKPGDVSIAARTHEELPLASRLFATNLVTRLALAGILLVTFYPYASSVTTLGRAAASGLGFLIATPLTVFVTIFSILVACGIALRRESVRQAFGNALILLRKHPFILAEAAIILFGTAVIFTLLLAAALRLLAFLFSSYGVLSYLFSADSLTGLLSSLFLLLSTLMILGFMGFLVTFQYASWASIYDQLSLGPVRTALERYILSPLRTRFSRNA